MANAATATIQCDNQRVRVTQWHFDAGAATGYHRHAMDYVVVPVTEGRLAMIGPDGVETTTHLRPGHSYFREAGIEHNVINVNDYEFVFVEIELK